MKSYIYKSLHKKALESPNSLFIGYENACYSYREFLKKVDCFANTLTLAGAARGDVIIIRSSDPLNIATSIYSANKIGCIYIVLHASINDSAFEHILTETKPKILITDDIITNKSVTIEFSVCDDSISAIVNKLASHEKVGLPNDIYSVIYTSGTTGTPKGVLVKDDNISFSVEAINARLKYTRTDHIAVILPLAFDYGLYQIFLACSVGAQVRLYKQGKMAPMILKDMSFNRVNVLPLVPALAEAFIKYCLRDDDRHHYISKITNTGQRLPSAMIAKLQTAFPNAEIYPMYGLTECKRVSILGSNELKHKPSSVGKPLDGTKVVIIDENESELGPCKIGQILVQGPNVCAGYIKPDAAASIKYAFYDNEWTLFTGDYGYLDEEGYLFFDGRKDSLVKRKGYRFSTQELEQNVSVLPDVDAAVVIYDGDKEYIYMFVKSASATSEYIEAELIKKLEPYKLPNEIVVTKEFPLTPNMKFDVKKLLSTLSLEH